MNKKIVIIGNGFDLRHFLPTKYNHLITVLREIENFDFNEKSEINFEDIFGNLFKEKDIWFYEKINEYYETKEIDFDIEKLKSIQERLTKNSWFQYLKFVEDDKIETWIDFETEIVRVLKIIVEYFETTTSGLLRYPRPGQFESGLNYYFDGSTTSDFISNNLQIHVLKTFKLFQTTDYYYYFVNREYILEIGNKIQYYQEKRFYDGIYDSLEEFISIFNDYIIFIVNEFYNNFQEDKMENFIIKDGRFLFDKISKIYSFNYTDTFHNLYKYKKLEDNVLRELVKGDTNIVDFLHGEAIDDWEIIDNLKIVLGVDDIEKSLKNHKLFQFTKYFQKLHKGTYYLFLDNLKEMLGYKMPQNFDFYFWGHSLDVSDREYIQDVFQIVDKTSGLIKIFYHSISGKADQLKNLLNIIEKDTIEKMMKTKKLIFIESTPENLFKEL